MKCEANQITPFQGEPISKSTINIRCVIKNRFMLECGVRIFPKFHPKNPYPKFHPYFLLDEISVAKWRRLVAIFEGTNISSTFHNIYSGYVLRPTGF